MFYWFNFAITDVKWVRTICEKNAKFHDISHIELTNDTPLTFHYLMNSFGT